MSEMVDVNEATVLLFDAIDGSLDVRRLMRKYADKQMVKV